MKILLKPGNFYRTEKDEFAQLLEFVDSSFTQSHTTEFWNVQIFDRGLHGEIIRNCVRQFIIPKEFYDVEDIDMEEVRKFRILKSVDIAVTLAREFRCNTYIYKEGAHFIVTEDKNEFDYRKQFFEVIYKLLTLIITVFIPIIIYSLITFNSS